MGCLPGVFTGYQSINDEKTRAKFEEAWGCKLDPAPGMTLPEIFHAAGEKKIKSVFLLVGENPLLSEPTMKHMADALSSLDFLVVQDIFLSETAQFADVVLPAASFAEKDGTFTNTERRIQRVRKALDPPGQAKADWEIICQIATKMGKKGFEYASPSEIMDEIAELTPSYGGVCFARLDKETVQWPCPTLEHPGTPILHTQIFTRGKGQFIPLEYRPPAELPDKQYPLILTGAPVSLSPAP
jgi:formate dehydrogenase major subunit/formate dehydrogenase alpha subunit